MLCFILFVCRFIYAEDIHSFIVLLTDFLDLGQSASTAHSNILDAKCADDQSNCVGLARKLKLTEDEIKLLGLTSLEEGGQLMSFLKACNSLQVLIKLQHQSVN